MKNDATLRPQELLRRADWVRSLAGALLSDSHQADDAAQDAWVTALRRDPESPIPERAWFARVVRNAARHLRRGERHRRWREEASARPEGTSPASELVERAELQRELAGYALELEEPYRSVVLLRYWEGLPPRAIASRLGCPVATVRTRLQRAHARLKERLERRYGDRSAWAAVLARLVAPPASVAVGASALTAFLWPAAAVAVLGSLAIAWRLRPSVPSTTETTELVAVLAPRDDPSTDAAAVQTPLAGDARDAVTTPAPTAEDAPTPVSIGEGVAGRLVGLDGRPLAGFVLGWKPYLLNLGEGRASWPSEEPSPDTATTDADGRFVLGGRGADYGFWPAPVSPEWTIVASGTARPPEEEEPLFVAARAVRIAGTIRNGDGAPLPGVFVERRVNPRAFVGFTVAADWEQAGDVLCKSDAEGRYAFLHVPALTELEARIDANDGELWWIRSPLPAVAYEDFDLVLRPPAPKDLGDWRPTVRRVAGVVLLPRGAPAAGATVGLGGRSAVAGDQGDFEIRFVSSEPGPFELFAALDGYRPVVRTGFLERFLLAGGDVENVALQLGAEPLAIEGRLVDAVGLALEGWCVDVLDGTPCGSGTFVETSAQKEGLRTDTQGRFRIGGLSERSYRLRAYKPSADLVTAASAPLPAGSRDALLRLPDDPYHALVRGRVETKSGVPLPGLSISAGVLERHGGFYANTYGETDAEGRFELCGVPKERVLLQADGPTGESAMVPIEAWTPGEELVLVAHGRSRFRLTLADDDPADAFTILDAAGRELYVQILNHHGSYGFRRVARGAYGAKAFPVCEVGDEAHELVLYQGVRALRRLRLDLVPGTWELQTVRP